jgi:hypothetical protein
VRPLSWKPVACFKLVTFLRNCGCIEVASSLGVPSPLQSVTTNNYSAVANSHTLKVHYCMQLVFSVCCIFTGSQLVKVSNAVASSLSVFTSLLTSNCLRTNFYSSNCHNAAAHYVASAQTTQNTLSLTVPPLVCVHLLQPLPSTVRCSQSRYLVTAVVQLLILRSFPSNGSTCYNIFLCIFSCCSRLPLNCMWYPLVKHSESTIIITQWIHFLTDSVIFIMYAAETYNCDAICSCRI